MRCLLALAVPLLAAADDPKPMYKPHDMKRPRPAVVDPGSPSRPPSDAVVLFDGKDLSAWKMARKQKDNSDAAKWKVADGHFEVVPTTGPIETRQAFGDAQVHIEWATPAEVKGSGQGRGNSGVYLGGFDEVQVLDSWDNDTYPDGQAAALYGKFPPRVNASRRPGEWQTYDIVAELAKTDAGGKIVRPARLTVLHNGVLAHHAVEFPKAFGEYRLLLQDHKNPVRFRNVWVRPLKGYDAK